MSKVIAELSTSLDGFIAPRLNVTSGGQESKSPNVGAAQMTPLLATTPKALQLNGPYRV